LLPAQGSDQAELEEIVEKHGSKQFVRKGSRPSWSDVASGKRIRAPGSMLA
jgi:hypothetical protein